MDISKVDRKAYPSVSSARWSLVPRVGVTKKKIALTWEWIFLALIDHYPQVQEDVARMIEDDAKILHDSALQPVKPMLKAIAHARDAALVMVNEYLNGERDFKPMDLMTHRKVCAQTWFLADAITRVLFGRDVDARLSTFDRTERKTVVAAIQLFAHSSREDGMLSDLGAEALSDLAERVE